MRRSILHLLSRSGLLLLALGVFGLPAKARESRALQAARS
jgi:hypothetical protein